MPGAASARRTDTACHSCRVNGTSCQRVLTGWGRTPRSTATVIDGASPDDVAALLADQGTPTVLARGLGRSYGDAALNAGGLVLRDVGRRPEPVVDVAAQRVTAAAGTPFAELLARTLPHGLTLPVLPGTRHVTLGGAVATDVHGKNHHTAGSIGAWLDEVVLVDGTGTVRRLSPGADGEAFWATLGGMGLTGVIISATLRLLPVATSWVWVRRRRLSWPDLLLAMTDSTAAYHVAWMDLYSPGDRWGRGVLDEGDHAQPAQLPPRARAAPLSYRPGRVLPAPPTPVRLVGRPTAKAFSDLWWRRAPDDRAASRGLPAFFAPLDGLSGWNRLYGPHGFRQYQFAVPFGAEEVLESCARLLSTTTTFLPVLKRLGPRSGGHLSFPLPGWTLAVDIPAAVPALAALLDRADRLVAAAGGRVYLAKDSRLSRDVLPAMYPRLAEWRTARDRLDPQSRLRSDLGVRLGLC